MNREELQTSLELIFWCGADIQHAKSIKESGEIRKENLEIHDKIMSHFDSLTAENELLKANIEALRYVGR